jgi:hypothetical protein
MLPKEQCNENVIKVINIEKVAPIKKETVLRRYHNDKRKRLPLM